MTHALIVPIFVGLHDSVFHIFGDVELSKREEDCSGVTKKQARPVRSVLAHGCMVKYMNLLALACDFPFRAFASHFAFPSVTKAV